MLVFPAEGCFTAITVDVRHRVQSCEEDAFFGRAAAHVDHRVEQIGSTLATLKGFTDEFVMVGEVSPTVDAGVRSVTGGEVGSEGLHHPGMLSVYGRYCFLVARLLRHRQL